MNYIGNIGLLAAESSVKLVYIIYIVGHEIIISLLVTVSSYNYSLPLLVAVPLALESMSNNVTINDLVLYIYGTFNFQSNSLQPCSVLCNTNE